MSVMDRMIMTENGHASKNAHVQVTFSNLTYLEAPSTHLSVGKLHFQAKPEKKTNLSGQS